MDISTADLCDRLGPNAQICQGNWRRYGGTAVLAGTVQTLKTFEDAGLIRQTLSEAGQGRVLVVDAGGSLNAAVLGDRMAELGQRAGWAGVLIQGAVRDTRSLGDLNFGIFALGHIPRRGSKTGDGTVGLPITVGGVCVQPHDFMVVDEDGVVLTQLAHVSPFLGREEGFA